ncbi:MAG: suppressor of fused domain protein [Planctomycetaceae bacterium]|nr:suppressor of fused domain protein [Planctomycetaceae bacterium]
MTKTDDWFEDVWEHREERLYPKLFGSVGDAIYPLSPAIFTDTFRQEFDPRWLHCGVFESPPNSKHASWLYVTSGLSNAWEDDEPDPTSPSGLGCEFVFETSGQARWAIVRMLHVMAFQILLAHGRYPDRDVLELYDRIPLRDSLTPEPSELTWLMVAPPAGTDRFQLDSGEVELLALVGITEGEAQHAREHSGGILLQRLQEADAFPVTNPQRGCIIL